MYKKKDRNQIKLDIFEMPFGGKLNADNRWVKLESIVPWDMVEDIYAASFKNERSDGAKPIPARIAFGAIYIKEQETLSDVRTAEYIRENPYMQYFLGYEAFREEAPFDASMMVHFRKRFPKEAIAKINEEMYRRQQKPPDPPEDGGNSGKLILDATCAPADIRYPTDESLLNECREDTEAIIDLLWEHTSRKGHKTSYHRKKARKKHLAIAKQRRPRRSKINRAVAEQLSYVKKNIGTIERLLIEAPNVLAPRHIKQLGTIRQVACQQEQMLREGSRSVPDRIVSIRQPHVRPIVRGKARAAVEFGQKLELSVVDGYTFIDVQSFDNFNEGVTLIESVEKYKRRFGFYPEAVLADKAFRNRGNLAYCKEHGIRLSGPRLGRPKASELAQDKELAYQDSCERNTVESRNGIAKRRYGLNLIMATLSCTAMTEAALKVLAMNAQHLLRILLRLFRKWCVLDFYCPGG